MRLSTAKNIVKRAIEAQLDLAKNPDASESRAIVPYLQGKVGIGKSSTVHQAAFELGQKLGIKIYVQMISLAQYDPAEIAGWLLPNDDKTAMIRIKPDWLEPEGDYDVIVYFFDELPQAIVANQNIAGQIFQEKRIGSFKLPEVVDISLIALPDLPDIVDRLDTPHVTMGSFGSITSFGKLQHCLFHMTKPGIGR